VIAEFWKLSEVSVDAMGAKALAVVFCKAGSEIESCVTETAAVKTASPMVAILLLVEISEVIAKLAK